MESMLDQFWCFYLYTHPYETPPEKQRQLDALLEKEDAMRQTFTPEQTALFLAYNEAVGAYQTTSERAAFQNGIRCAVRFLTEAMRAE